MNPKTILYIEDDHDMVDVVSEIMAYEAYRVITDCGRNISTLLKEHPIGLILIEEELGWAWGSDLCYELKENTASRHIPVIMISGIQNIETICEKCGANGYVKKPFDMYDVVDIVNRLFVLR